MPRAFSARLVRTISTSAVAGLAMVGVFAATASADVNSVRIDDSQVVEIDSSGNHDLQVTRFIFNSTSDDATVVDSDATTPEPGDSGAELDRRRLVNSV